MRYRNFDLDLFAYQRAEGIEHFRVRVAQSPAGRQKYNDAESVVLDTDLRSQLPKLEERGLNPAELIVLDV